LSYGCGWTPAGRPAGAAGAGRDHRPAPASLTAAEAWSWRGGSRGASPARPGTPRPAWARTAAAPALARRLQQHRRLASISRRSRLACRTFRGLRLACRTHSRAVARGAGGFADDTRRLPLLGLMTARRCSSWLECACAVCCCAGDLGWLLWLLCCGELACCLS
jgi:hypothetical protein